MQDSTVNPAVSDKPIFEMRDCPGCGRCLDGLPSIARFCPACGAIVRTTPVIIQSWLEKLVGVARHRPHFLMREGYANALLHLGWKYESGLGASRNAAEAMRCYCKSAKLGNDAARARVSPKPVLPTIGDLP